MKKILLIDNYDSFTYNLYHYIAEEGGEVQVVRNDQMQVVEVIAGYNHGDFAGIILSPGPCDPDGAGICLPVITESKGRIPLLGVCLGHQAIGQAFGGKVLRAPEPVHGKVHPMFHQGKGLFAGIPNPFNATRYHSLIVDRASLPDCLEITAESKDGLIMGLQHEKFPIHGVQFHPESIASQHGHALLKNFLDLL